MCRVPGPGSGLEGSLGLPVKNEVIPGWEEKAGMGCEGGGK